MPALSRDPSPFAQTAMVRYVFVPDHPNSVGLWFYLDGREGVELLFENVAMLRWFLASIEQGIEELPERIQASEPIRVRPRRTERGPA